MDSETKKQLNQIENKIKKIVSINNAFVNKLRNVIEMYERKYIDAVEAIEELENEKKENKEEAQELLDAFLGSERWETELAKTPPIKQIDVVYITKSEILKEWTLAMDIDYNVIYNKYKNDPEVVIICDASEE